MIKKPGGVSATSKKQSASFSKSFTSFRPSAPSSKMLDKSVCNPEKQETDHDISKKDDEQTKKIKAHWAAIRTKFQHYVGNIDQEEVAGLQDQIPPE